MCTTAAAAAAAAAASEAVASCANARTMSDGKAHRQKDTKGSQMEHNTQMMCISDQPLTNNSIYFYTTLSSRYPYFDLFKL
jgi:hypothetical protein